MKSYEMDYRSMLNQLKIEQKIIKNIVRDLITLMLCAIAFKGCTSLRVYSKPFIMDNSEWDIIEVCHGEGCAYKVEALRYKDISIRVIAFNGIVVDDIFTVQLIFSPSKKSEYQFDPSLSSITLNNGEIIEAKGLRCARTPDILVYLQHAQPLIGPLSLDENDCFILFFDVNPPSVEDEFILNIDGLSKSGEPIKVPVIYFQKAIGHRGYGKKL